MEIVVPTAGLHCIEKPERGRSPHGQGRTRASGRESGILRTRLIGHTETPDFPFTVMMRCASTRQKLKKRP
jgi:hypothetical protein